MILPSRTEPNASNAATPSNNDAATPIELSTASQLHQINLPNPSTQFTVALGRGEQTIHFQLPEGEFITNIQIAQAPDGRLTLQLSSGEHDAANDASHVREFKDGSQTIKSEDLAKLGSLFSDEELELDSLDSAQLKLDNITKAEYTELVSNSPDFSKIVNANSVLRLLEFSGFVANNDLNQACADALYDLALQFNPSEDSDFKNLLIDIAKQEANDNSVKGYHYSKDFTSENSSQREQQIPLLDCMIAMAFPEANTQEASSCKTSLLKGSPNFSFYASPKANQEKIKAVLEKGFNLALAPVFDYALNKDKATASLHLNVSDTYGNRQFTLRSYEPLFAKHFCEAIKNTFGQNRAHQILKQNMKNYCFYDQQDLKLLEELLSFGLPVDKAYSIKVPNNNNPFSGAISMTPLEAAVITDNQSLFDKALSLNASTAGQTATLNLLNHTSTIETPAVTKAANLGRTTMLKSLLEHRVTRNESNTELAYLMPRIAKLHPLNEVINLSELIVSGQAMPDSESVLLALAQRNTSSTEESTLKESVFDHLLQYQPHINSEMSQSIYQALQETGASERLQNQFEAPAPQRRSRIQSLRATLRL